MYKIEKRYQMWSSSGLTWSKWFNIWNISGFDTEAEAKAKIKELPKRLCEKGTTYPNKLKNEYRVVKVD